VGLIFAPPLSAVRECSGSLVCWWRCWSHQRSYSTSSMSSPVSTDMGLREYTVLVCNQPLRPTQLAIPSTAWKTSTGQRAVAVLCGWEGNRRSGVASVVRHRLCAISAYGAQGPIRKGDGHPAYTFSHRPSHADRRQRRKSLDGIRTLDLRRMPRFTFTFTVRQ